MVTAVQLGSGEFKYEVAVDWETIPDGYQWREVAGVITDANDNVYVFNRGPHPMIVFDKDGNFIKSWGEDVFVRPHGASSGPDNTLYLTDDGDHTVRQCTLDGEVLMTIGSPGQAADLYSGAPFNRCTHVATDPDNGDLFVSDGYGNAKVHKYSADGEPIMSWGGPGTGPGEFNIVHNIATDRDGYVYVADRENHRVQIFDRNGNFETEWSHLHRPCAIYITDDQRVYVGELGWGALVERNTPNIGPRITIMNTRGNVLERIGNGYGLDVGQFVATHGMCVDSQDNIYVGEVAHTSISHFDTPPDVVRSFQKLAKV